MSINRKSGLFFRQAEGAKTGKFGCQRDSGPQFDKTGRINPIAASRS
jgi:hypothetical protein